MELQPQDFAWDRHRLIYQAMLDLAQGGQPIDVVTVTSRLKDLGLLDQVGGPVFLSCLSEQVGTASNVLHYARRVKDKTLVRSLRDAAMQIAATCEQPWVSARELLDWAEALVHEKCSLHLARGDRHVLGTLAEQETEVLAEIYASKRPPGIPTGYADLDRFVSWCPREFVILAGRTSMGKTNLALNLGLRAAAQGVWVGLVSLEMSKEQITRRLMAMHAGLDANRLNRVRLTGDEWAALYHAVDDLKNLPFWIDDSPALSVMEVRSLARRAQAKGELDLLIVDYLQLMRPHRRGRTREEEVAETSRGLKALAAELNIPVIAVAQLNRKLEERPDKRPRLSDLRESGALEQDADLVLFLYRDEVYRQNSPDAGTAEVIVAKNRNGRTGTVKLAYRDHCLRFDNLEDSDTC
jgi:replicative DNA helicase